MDNERLTHRAFAGKALQQVNETVREYLVGKFIYDAGKRSKIVEVGEILPRFLNAHPEERDLRIPVRFANGRHAILRGWETGRHATLVCRRKFRKSDPEPRFNKLIRESTTMPVLGGGPRTEFITITVSGRGEATIRCEDNERNVDLISWADGTCEKVDD